MAPVTVHTEGVVEVKVTANPDEAEAFKTVVPVFERRVPGD
jgi:hypothetical protein